MVPFIKVLRCSKPDTSGETPVSKSLPGKLGQFGSCVFLPVGVDMVSERIHKIWPWQEKEHFPDVRSFDSYGTDTERYLPEVFHSEHFTYL